jgi:twinkle protein
MDITAILVGKEFAEYLAQTEEQARVLPIEAFTDTARQALYGTPPPAALLPWSKTHDLVALRPGEVTLWAGTNGSGKSMLLSHVVLSLINQSHKVCIASFEMKPVKQIERMLRQTSRGPRPTELAFDKFFAWAAGSVWLYDQQGTVKPQAVYKVCRYAAEKLGCSHIVIDSLMKCVRGEDDYNGQKDFVDEVTSIARDLNIHIHLVHHVRKPESAEYVPSKFDAKGSGSISDQVDNVAIVWRNKAKEALLEKQARGSTLSNKEAELVEAPDCLLCWEKQRNGDWEGRISLWFHNGALQYCADKRKNLHEFY